MPTGALEALHREPTPGKLALDYLVHNEWLTIFMLFGALAIYSLRSGFRFAYGLVECAIGAIAIWASLHIRDGRLSVGLALPSIDDSLHLSTVFLTLVSGIYIIVRGLDNLPQKLTTWLTRFWDAVFSGSRKNKLFLGVSLSRHGSLIRSISLITPTMRQGTVIARIRCMA
jgi:hypothetical protein